MASYNRIIMMGNLTRDPEHKVLSSGHTVCRFGLASNRQFKNKQTGNLVQEVCFIEVDVWGAQAETCRLYLSKGRPVLVDGRLKFETWQESDGTKRSRHSIVAERVTFLYSSSQAEASNQEEDAIAPENPASSANFVAATTTVTTTPKESISDSPPKQHKTKRVSKGLEITEGPATTPGGEVTLKDDAPFEDDLPF